MPLSHISFVQATVNTNSLNAALALAEVGLLSEVITTIAYNPDGGIARFLNLLPQNLGTAINKELNRRTWQPLPKQKLRCHPIRELIRLGLIKAGLNRRFGLDNRALIDWVYLALDQHMERYHLQELDAVYAYEDEAALTFQTAKQRNVLCLYDLPSVYYPVRRELEQEEAERFPELAPLLQMIHEPVWKLERKEIEIELADHIFVASSVNKNALVKAGVPTEKVSVIPYGAPIDYFQPMPKDEKFRAVFVGGISPHKGVHYLLKAWKELHLPNAELLLIGGNRFSSSWLHEYSNYFRHINSVPHFSLNQYYSAGSVLVFPSLMDGFGLVLLEAMACGIPVITTLNTAGSDIITDGVEGFIVPIRDVEALKEKLEWCYQHPQELAEMGRMARRKAEQLTWDLYRQRLVSRVKEILKV